MRYPSVLLVHPSYQGSFYSPSYFSIGLGYVSMALEKAGIENRIIDLNFGSSLRALKRSIEEFRPSLIGVTMMSFRYQQTYRLIENIRHFFPDIPLVVGGPHISSFRARALEECKAIDYGVTLEGEKTIVELCQSRIPISDIRGLLYRAPSKEILYNGDRPFIGNLDENGFPTYSKFELNKYPSFIPILTSRGCPYRCIYCSVKVVAGPEFRARSAKSVVDEFEYWHKQGLRDFGIVDDCFTLDRNRVVEICDEIKERNLTGLKIILGNGVRTDKVDRQLLTRMKEAGFYYIAFGVEAGNNRLLNALKKGVTLETIERAIANACDLNFRVALFFLIGSPGETEMDIEESIRVALKYPVYEAVFNNLIPFPGTELYQWVKDNQYFVQRDDFLKNITQRSNEPVYATAELPYHKRKNLHKRANRAMLRHTLKIKRKIHYPATLSVLRGYGLPPLVAKTIADFYWSDIFYPFFRQSGLPHKVKGVIDKFKS